MTIEETLLNRYGPLLSLTQLAILDHEKVGELMRVNGDLGRLGGLLKLWLSGDLRVAHLDDATIRAVLWKIESTQDELHRIAKAVVRPRARS